jgi:hypothetical protein
MRSFAIVTRSLNMRAATTIGILALAALALGACQKKPAQDQNIAIDQPVADNATLANADIEALPPDESSGTSANELENGSDNPDVTDLNTANSY